MYANGFTYTSATALQIASSILLAQNVARGREIGHRIWRAGSPDDCAVCPASQNGQCGSTYSADNECYYWSRWARCHSTATIGGTANVNKVKRLADGGCGVNMRRDVTTVWDE